MQGLIAMLLGYGMKLIVAQRAEILVNQVYSMYQDANSFTMLMAAFFYAVQIYCDFASYSMIAVGVGRLFGFELVQNFKQPYFAKNLTDFWRRWHISLSTWFKEYIYIPLGGNRCGKLRQFRNIAVVWLLTGVWHGAQWNFIIWGCYFGVLLIIEKVFLLKALKKAPAFVRHIYALFFITIGWLIFYHTDLTAGVTCFKAMFGGGVVAFASKTNVYDMLRLMPLAVLCAIASTPVPKRYFDRLWEKCNDVRSKP